MHTPLGPGGEFEMIRSVWRSLGDRQAATGDDCTFITVGTEQLAVTSDIMIEGTHFRRGWISMEDIGWRATTASLSDVAAVAGEPVGVMVSVGVHEEWPAEWTTELMNGVGAAAESVGAKVLGGDLVRSEVLVVDVFALARVTAPVTRSGAQVGDGIYVTGTLGAPAAALADWMRGEQPDAEARARFARPAARVEEAAWLAAEGASAMIDVSDGVLADAAHIASASKIECEVDSNRIPVHAAATPEQAMTGGEEFELLVTLRGVDEADVTTRFRDRFGLELTRIGQCVGGAGVRLVRAGEQMTIPDSYTHFRP